MDSIDEFELKPLTPGLGFHKKPVSLKQHVAKAGFSQNLQRRGLPPEPPSEIIGENLPNRTSKEIIAELHKALEPEKKTLRLTEILPREITDMPADRRPHVPEISPIEKVDFQIPDKNLAASTGARRGASDSLINPLSPVSVSFAAILLDGAMVMAVSLIFLISLIVVTGVDLLSVAQSTQTEFATQLSLLVMYLAVFAMYVIVARSFFGKTIGEWTFDLQMGDDQQIQRASYPAQVLWRAMVTLFTGIIVLPILSFVFGRDLAARISGLQLYRRNIAD